MAPVLVLYGVPAWAAAPETGCTRPGGAQPRSRSVRFTALPAYQTLIRAVQALGRATGLALAYWAPWNEPNHDYFIAPQRGSPDPGSPAASPLDYTALVRAMKPELAPGQQMVLGELAAYLTPGPRATSIAEFVAAVAPDVICASAIWSFHTYALDDRGLRVLESALDWRGACGTRARLWITETVAPAPDARVADAGQGCPQIAAALARWSRDPRLDVAFQDEVREDPFFRTGLADAGLTRLDPAYAPWLLLGRGAPAHC